MSGGAIAVFFVGLPVSLLVSLAFIWRGGHAAQYRWYFYARAGAYLLMGLAFILIGQGKEFGFWVFGAAVVGLAILPWMVRRPQLPK